MSVLRSRLFAAALAVSMSLAARGLQGQTPTPPDTGTDEWLFIAGLYGFFPAMEGTVTARDFIQVPVDVTFSELLDHLKMNLTGHFEAQHGRFGGGLDFFYVRLGAASKAPYRSSSMRGSTCASGSARLSVSSSSFGDAARTPGRSTCSEASATGTPTRGLKRTSTTRRVERSTGWTASAACACRFPWARASSCSAAATSARAAQTSTGRPRAISRSASAKAGSPEPATGLSTWNTTGRPRSRSSSAPSGTSPTTARGCG